MRSRLSEVLENGVAAPSVPPGGLTTLSADGDEVPVEAVLTALETDEEAVPCLLITLKTDSRPTAKGERERRTSRERLEASNRDLEAFAPVAAHDLQEPLRKIRAFSDRVAHSTKPIQSCDAFLWLFSRRSRAEEDIYRSYDLGVAGYKPVTSSGLVHAMNELGDYWFELVELPQEPVAESLVCTGGWSLSAMIRRATGDRAKWVRTGPR